MQVQETWGTNNTAAYNQSVVEYSYNLGNVTPVQALVNGVAALFHGFWYLGAGIGAVSNFLLLYPMLILQALMGLLTSSGSRTLFMISLLSPILIWLLSSQQRHTMKRQFRKKIPLIHYIGDGVGYGVDRHRHIVTSAAKVKLAPVISNSGLNGRFVLILPTVG